MLEFNDLSVVPKKLELRYQWINSLGIVDMNANNFAFVAKSALGLVSGCVMVMAISIVNVYAVTIPFTFSSGSTATASEVNSNFQAINNGLPYFMGYTSTLSSTISSSATQNIGTNLATSPSTAGTAVITYSGTVCISTNTSGTVTFQLLVDGSAFGSSQNFTVPAISGGVMCSPFSNTSAAPMTAGVHTVALQGSNSTVGTATINNITVVGIVYY